jgi:hypothetical protein
MVFPGWTVVNAIPYDVIAGLMTGQYQMYGGVIRWATGTVNAGQIVRHLIPAALNPLSVIPGLDFIPGIIANFQLNQLKEMTQFNTHQLFQISGQINSLSQVTQQVLQMATGTAVLSGLGLAVSSISFAVLNSKLNAIDGRLQEIQKDVKDIKNFLESTERARLLSALNDLSKINSKTPSEHRHTILHHSRQNLAQINMRYRGLLSEAKTMETAIANEEYFSLTALAQARCTAELGMLNMAYQELIYMNSFWQTEARRIAKDILIGEYPQRFLATDFATDVSVAELATWLDFVYNEKRGIVWIDDLRLKMNERWYNQEWFGDIENFKNVIAEKWQSKEWFSDTSSGLNKNIGIGAQKEKTMLIPALRKLIARSAVLESYVGQYEILEAQNMKPSEFEAKLSQLPSSSSVNGYFILEAEA